MDLDEVKERAAKHDLNINDFSIKIINNFLSNKKFIIYSKDEYYFELTNQDNFFPYFGNTSNKEKIEIWLNSLKETFEKKNKILKTISQGQKERQLFKKKFNV